MALNLVGWGGGWPIGHDPFEGMAMGRYRIGAYILPGDPTWLAKSLAAYYDLLDELVVPLPIDGVGWTGRPIPVSDVMEIIRRLDHRGIIRVIEGSWTEPDAPMLADTAQRQAALNVLRGRVDWVLQIDNDEFLPEIEPLLRAIDAASEAGLDAVEWPMRVLFRRTRRWVFEVVDDQGSARYDYPGAVAVRPAITLTDARRVEGSFLRAVVSADSSSLQVTRPVAAGEVRWRELRPADAIVHNSWARSPWEVWRKTRSWGHAAGSRSVRYFFLRWMPAPWTWRHARDLHPFSQGLWPRLARHSITPELTDRVQ